MKQVKIIITETAANAPGKEVNTFNKETKVVSTIEAAKQFLIDRYGKMPRGRKKIYVDGPNNTAIEIGFLHSFWNKDWSHNSKNWFQTDWIEIYNQELTPVKL